MAIQGIPTFQQTMDQMKAERAGKIRLAGDRELSVVILGAGPGGLIRAIESIMNNHRTQVIEKRASGSGRPNVVALNAKTIPILQKYGIYQWLIEQELMYPYEPDKRVYVSVRLKDLELAMKAVLAEIAPGESVIQYEKTVGSIQDQHLVKATVELHPTNGEPTEWVDNVDLIVNTEGARSSTNEMLGIDRVQILENVPVISAIFEDNRPKVTGVCSFVEYIGKTIAQTAVSVYYYTIFFFKFIFQQERFTSEDRTIAGALILRTPGQNYLGCGFTKARSDELLELKTTVDDLRKSVRDAAPDAKEDLEKQLAEAESKLGSFATYWINLSFCAANVFAFIARWYNKTEIQAETAGRFPLKDFHVIEIGADCATTCQRKMGQTAYVIAGDALATVDPTTGLGANTAIGTGEYFKNLMDGMESNQDLDGLLEKYTTDSEQKIAEIHVASKALRSVYRPDAAAILPEGAQIHWRHQGAGVPVVVIS